MTRAANHAGTTVNVRYSCGSYVARGGGRTASCTAGGDEAVAALARKLGWPRYEARDVQQLAGDHTRLVIRPERRSAR